MRFLIYGIFLAGWCTTWVWTYTCHIKKACCTGRFALEVPSSEESGLDIPIGFEAFDSKPVTGVSFTYFRDSLIARLDSGKVLEITGFFTDVESPELGADRAVAVLDLIASQLEEHRFALRSRRVGEEDLLVGNLPWLRAYEVKILAPKARMDSLVGSESRQDF